MKEWYKRVRVVFSGGKDDWQKFWETKEARASLAGSDVCMYVCIYMNIYIYYIYIYIHQYHIEGAVFTTI